MAQRTCSVDGCGRPARARGWCEAHYRRWKRNGSIGPAQVHGYERSVRERLDAYTAVAPSGCWEWTGAIDRNGYGRIRVNGKLDRAHRASYETHVGQIPDGLHIDHLCRNRRCLNPDHLEPVTPAENVRRGEGHGSETHCPEGHPYAGDNLYEHTDRHGYTRRMCRACNVERGRRLRARRRHDADIA